jgi:hypothetical protein
MPQRGYGEDSTQGERPSSEQAQEQQPAASSSSINEEPTDNLEKRRKRAHEMAGDAIDGVSDVSASLGDQASRKRRLLEGPDEFQIIRVDRAKAKPE